MGFIHYKAKEQEAGLFELRDGRKLVFSGKEGLVARWIGANPEHSQKPWHVDAAAWLTLSLGNSPVAEDWVVFEQRDEAGNPRHARLLGVGGVCGNTKTEMMFSLVPLLSEGSSPILKVRLEQKQRIWSEELSLEGVFPGQGTWRWCAPKLAIGAATVG